MAWRAWDWGGTPVSEELSAAAFDASGRLWVGGAMGALLRSDDGGQSFAVVNKLRGIRGLWCDGGDRLVACAGGRMVASEDGGATFAPTSCRGGHNDNLRESGGRLWATNIRSRVLVSDDDGVRFRSMATGCRRYLYSVGANRSGTVCVGSDEALGLSRDGGASFVVMPLDHREYLRAVEVDEAGAVVLVGDGGKVHLIDARGRLTAAHIDERVSLHGLCRVGRSLVAVGYHGRSAVIRRSDDGGRRWVAERVVGAPGRHRLNALAVGSGGEVVAVGTRGWVARRRPASPSS